MSASCRRYCRHPVVSPRQRGASPGYLSSQSPDHCRLKSTLSEPTHAVAMYPLKCRWASGTRGTVAPKDPRKAAYWYLKAASAGDAAAQQYVVEDYELGKGLRRSHAKALT